MNIDMVASKRKKRISFSAFDAVNIFLLLIVAVVTLYPFYNVLIISLNDPTDTLMGGLYTHVRKFTFDNYMHFFSNKDFAGSFAMSVLRTVVGVPTSVLFTAAFAYGVSKKYLVGQKLILRLMMITMYVNGGLIPTYILIRSIGLYENFLVYIIPALFSAYNAIILITFFKGIPAEIEESVRVDGGNDLVIFFRIVLPISIPVIATIALFNAVTQWNSWFDTILYGGRKLMTLQAKLVEIIRDADAARKLEASGQAITASIVRAHFKPTVESVKATAMMVTAVPIVLVYPFAQKYFVKGIMVGSLKG